MYRIALCDDDPTQLNTAERLLEEYKSARPESDFTVTRFTAIEPLLEDIEAGISFDLMLLDIYLPGKTGMDGYREMQRNGFEFPVIFLTTSLDHAVSAFEVNAVQYLVKPVDSQALFAAVDKAFLSIADERRRHIVLRVNNQLRRICLRDILYCESQNNNLLFYFTDGSKLSVKMTMTALCQILSDFPEFVRVGIAHIVNLLHVDSIGAKEIHLDSGRIIWIPRGAYPALKERYFEFFCDGGGRDC